MIVQFIPYLASSSSGDKIAVFSQKDYAQNTVSLHSGEKTSCRFYYPSFDPAILIVDLTFHSWQTQGYLSLYCNNVPVVTIVANSQNPEVQLTTVTFSGYELVEPQNQMSFQLNNYLYANEILFASTTQNGFEGIFSYRISVRGSR
jgi:hypothetical protein